jgi:hypothetical protein
LNDIQGKSKTMAVQFSDEDKPRLAMSAEWPIDAAVEYFDLASSHIEDIVDVKSSRVDRFELEKRMVQEKLIGLDWLALQFGVLRDALEAAMKRPPKGTNVGPFHLEDYRPTDGHYLLPKSVAEAWIKELLPKHKTWSSLDSRARDLAMAIGGGIRNCAVSKYFEEPEVAVATCRCVVTWDSVSRKHQEYMDNRKHLSLEPDHVGWHAICQKKVDVSVLYRSDLTNLANYVQERGREWPIL